MRTIASTFIAVSNAQTTYTDSPAKPTAMPAAASQRSPWHSPVPYLFGGLAAMLGLIAFALLILACSYWRLTGREEGRRDGQRRDIEGGESAEKDDSADSGGKAVVVYEEKILVIMAGDEKPTFLATPVCAKLAVSALNDGKGSEERREKEVEERESLDDDQKVVKKEVLMVIDHDHHDCGENSHDEVLQEQNQ